VLRARQLLVDLPGGDQWELVHDVDRLRNLVAPLLISDVRQPRTYGTQQ
jgi:hypothetical protein